MRVEIADAMGSPYVITTKRLDLLAIWLVDTLADIKPTRDMPCRIIVWPSFEWGPDHGPYGHADWIQDTRILSDTPGVIRTPRDAVLFLSDQIERYEELKAKEAERI